MTFHGDGVKIKIAIITLDEPIYIPQVIEGIIKNSSKEVVLSPNWEINDKYTKY